MKVDTFVIVSDEIIHVVHFVSRDFSSVYVVLVVFLSYLFFLIENLVLTVSNARDLCLCSCMCSKVPFCSAFSTAEQTLPKHWRLLFYLFIYSNPAGRFCEPPQDGIEVHIEKNLLHISNTWYNSLTAKREDFSCGRDCRVLSFCLWAIKQQVLKITSDWWDKVGKMVWYFPLERKNGLGWASCQNTNGLWLGYTLLEMMWCLSTWSVEDAVKNKNSEDFHLFVTIIFRNVLLEMLLFYLKINTEYLLWIFEVIQPIRGFGRNGFIHTCSFGAYISGCEFKIHCREIIWTKFYRYTSSREAFIYLFWQCL